MESTTHSNLIEFTFQSLYRALSGQEPIDTDLLRTCLQLRVPKLSKCYDPFPKPSITSSAALKKGSIQLEDGVTVKVESYQQDLVNKISEKFAIDEIEAFILLRSFLYNEQYDYSPSSNGEGSSTGADVEAELLDSIAEFYFDERLFILRVFIPLYRAQADDQHPYHDLSTEILRDVAPDKTKLATSLTAEYVRRTNQELPAKVPHTSSSLAVRSNLAKQIIREQICMTEVIFWSTYNMRCPGSFVADVYEAVYSTSLGALQKNGDLLIDTEATQLLSDLHSIIVVTAVQILSVELLYEQGIDLEIVSLPRNGYFAQPEALIRIHNTVFATPQDPRFGPIVLAWACVIRRLALAAEGDEYPAEYVPLMELIVPDRGSRDAQWQEFTRVVLHPAFNLFGTFRQLLSSPILDTQAAAKSGSSLTCPNDVVIRAIIKGLLTGLTELIRVEYIEDYDGILETTIQLFGSGEYVSVAPLCAEFWQVDAQLPSSNRRALLEVTRDRFPVQGRPLVRLLRALSATGDFRGLEGYLSSTERGEIDFNRGGAAWAVYQYFDTLGTLTQMIPYGKDSAAASCIEMRNTSAGVVYTTLRPMRLPGGSIIPPKTVGTLMSDNEAGSPVVVLWQYQHSGWRLALGLLKEYVKRRQATVGTSIRFGVSSTDSLGRPSAAPVPKIANLSFEDIGIEEGLDDGVLVTDLLELFRAVLRNNHTLGPSLMAKMLPDETADAEGHELSAWERASLVEVIPVILQDALQFNGSRAGSTPGTELGQVTKLVTNTLGVMTALLPTHPGSLWSSLRSSTIFTSTARQKVPTASATPKLLAVERVAGTYPMTLALLDLLRALFDESVRKMYNVDGTFRAVKTDVLLRGLALVHNEIWIDFENWKYTRLAEKYQIGAKITALFAEILAQGPAIPVDTDAPFNAEDPLSSLATITRFVVDAFFAKAAPSTITPLISIISTCQATRQTLYKSRRYDDAHSLDVYLQSCLRLSRLVLVRKAGSSATRACLLEQGFFVGAGLAGRGSVADLRRTQISPLDNIARYFIRPPYELDVQIEAMKLLTTLCTSVSSCHPSPPSIVGHVGNAEEIVDYILGVVRHVDDDPQMRLAAWGFLNTVVDTQPALAALFLSGKMISSIIPSMAHASGSVSKQTATSRGTVIDAIDESLARWETLWETNPALLAPALSLLDSVFQHGREHPLAIDAIRKNARLWTDLVKLVKEPLWEAPGCDVNEMMTLDGVTHSSVHEATATHACQTLAKAHAVHILALELTDSGVASGASANTSKSASAASVTKLLEGSSDLDRLFGEAITNPTDPALHERAKNRVETSFSRLALDTLRPVGLQSERTFGDDYLFSSAFIEERLYQYAGDDRELVELASTAFKEILSLNLDWSMTDSHVALTRSWYQLLEVAGPLVRASTAAQKTLISAAKKVAETIAAESRSGPILTAVHADRLRVLYAALDVTWMYELSWDELLAIVAPMKIIVTHEVHNPLNSVTHLIGPAFHQTVLHLLYYCARKALSLKPDPTKIPATQRAVLSATISNGLLFTIDSLRVVFEQATEVGSEAIDADLQLMVAVFDACTRPSLGVGVTLWLARLQATNLIRASLDLFSRSDVSGTLQPAVVRSRRLPFYSQHILQFHRSLASLPSSAERLAHEGVMGSYAMNGLTPSLELAGVDVTHIGHHAWCTMVAVVAQIITILGKNGTHFVDAEVVGFVQLYGEQLSRTMAWHLGDNLTLSLVEEMEAVTALFHAIAITSSSRTDFPTAEILRAYVEKALTLLQQLNSAVSYPNQLARNLVAMTPDEDSVLQKEVEQGTIDSSIEYIDKGKHPLLASVVQTLLRISSTVLTTLVLANGGDMLLMRSDAPIPADLPLISPSSRVSSDEPATIGTLQELGNWSVQVVVHLLKTKNTPLPTSPSTPLLSTLMISPFDRRATMQAARLAIESLMVYTATQLARWVEREEASFDISGLASGRGDDRSDLRRAGRAGGRQSMSLMHNTVLSTVQDQARELSILASRAKDVLGKLADDDGESSVILLDILIGFTSAKLLKS